MKTRRPDAEQLITVRGPCHEIEGLPWIAHDNLERKVPNRVHTEGIGLWWWSTRNQLRYIRLCILGRIAIWRKANDTHAAAIGWGSLFVHAHEGASQGIIPLAPLDGCATMKHQRCLDDPRAGDPLGSGRCVVATSEISGIMTGAAASS